MSIPVFPHFRIKSQPRLHVLVQGHIRPVQGSAVLALLLSNLETALVFVIREYYLSSVSLKMWIEVADLPQGALPSRRLWEMESSQSWHTHLIALSKPLHHRVRSRGLIIVQVLSTKADYRPISTSHFLRQGWPLAEPTGQWDRAVCPKNLSRWTDIAWFPQNILLEWGQSGRCWNFIIHRQQVVNGHHDLWLAAMGVTLRLEVLTVITCLWSRKRPE